MSTPLIEARKLYRLYPEGDTLRPVLEDINLQVAAGRFVAIMGPSGSGKSTLLHVLSGLDLPSSGEALVDGKNLALLNDEQRTLLRRELVGFVFQFYNLVPNLTVAENIALPLMLMGVKRPQRDQRFERIVQLFGLKEKLPSRPHELSGGEMQRTSIARALVHHPRIVFADEPTGNLSTRAGAEVMDHLRRATDQMKQTILLVTHNPRDAGYADELHFLKDGRIDPSSSLTGTDIHETRITACMAELGI